MRFTNKLNKIFSRMSRVRRFSFAEVMSTNPENKNLEKKSRKKNLEKNNLERKNLENITLFFDRMEGCYRLFFLHLCT